MKILFYIWELPQTILALIIWGIMKVIGKVKRTGIVTDSDGKRARYIVMSGTMNGAYSLGEFILIGGGYDRDDWIEKAITHEYGHTIQSRYLGWLYLVVIGIPSMVASGIMPHSWLEKHFYTETWADALMKHTTIVVV